MKKSYKEKLKRFREEVLETDEPIKVIPWDNVSADPVRCQCCGALVYRRLARIEVGEYPNCRVYYIGWRCALNLDLPMKTRGEKK